MGSLDSAESGELRALAGRTVSRRFLHHYRGFFGRACRDFRAARPPTVKGLLYAYRSGLTGIHLLRTGECVGDVRLLAPVYGFDRVPELVARKAGGREHGVLADATRFEADLERLERTLQDAAAQSPLPPEATSADELNEFLIRMRKGRFT